MAPETTKLEAETRKEIDTKLTQAGWVIQDKSRLNLYASLGVAIREMDTPSGPADYMLFIDGKACGIIEAKREGTDLGGVTEQSGRYANSRSSHIERWGPADQPLPFLYEADVQESTSVKGGRTPGATKEPRPVSYNPDIPIEEFDDIIIDEYLRSIYGVHGRTYTASAGCAGAANLWRQALDKFVGNKFGRTSVRRAAGRAMGGAQQYIDAFLIGLTATPNKKTIDFFNQNLVSEYTHEDAVVDKVNVGYDIYRIKTEMTEKSNTIEAGTAVEIRERLTKAKYLEVLDKEEEYKGKDIDRSVLAPNQIRTVIQAYKDRCLKECFPERKWHGGRDAGGRATQGAVAEADKMEWVLKTLIFAKDDDHYDRIVDAVREVFDEGRNANVLMSVKHDTLLSYKGGIVHE